MKLVYMGTPRFAVPPLRSLRAAGHIVLGVVTRIDKQAGRGRIMTPPQVKLAAQDLGLPVFQPRRVREPEFVDTLRSLEPDAIVVAAYGQILPKDILGLPTFGCINIHASLLPAYRGAAPVAWAIIRGEIATGITIMQMDEGMDTGAILLQEHVPIEESDTTGTLTEKLSLLGARLITEALPRIEAGTLVPQPQDNGRATLAPLLKKADGRIDWNLAAAEIRNRVRGLSPWPGAYTLSDGKLIKLLEVEVATGSGDPGAVQVADSRSLIVGTGNGLLRIMRIQPEGKRAMSTAEFLQGHAVMNKKFL
jgi:methionyl-tRNA formyltransferase